MVFSSFSFLFLFLPAIFALYFCIPKRFRAARNAVLLVFSLFFYFWGEPRGIFVMLLVIGLCFAAGLLLHFSQRTGLRRLWLILATVGSLSFLLYYKYYGFFVENVNSLFGLSLRVKQVIMPIGISFFTFQSLSYVFDVYQRTVPAQKNPAYVALYVSLFPQLVAGPIVRYETVAQEITQRNESRDDFYEGLCRFIVGFGKKMLLANPLGSAATEIFSMQPDARSALLAWLGAALFAFQILFDFAGYSDMAIGLGRMFGFHFLENFDAPYISKSITEFWRRWHISLGTWFRDYIYIPLGGNRKGRVRQMCNILIVWTLTGLWHGASWNFVLWGLYFAVILLLEKLVLGKALRRLPAALQHMYALVLILIGWVIFNCTGLTELRAYLTSLFAFSRTSAADWNYVYYILREYGLELVAAVLLSTPIFSTLHSRFSERTGYELVRICVLFGVLALSLLALSTTSYNPFIYFRF